MDLLVGAICCNQQDVVFGENDLWRKTVIALSFIPFFQYILIQQKTFMQNVFLKTSTNQ